MTFSQTSKTPTQVLVAEDNRINQKVLKELLRKEGMDATMVANGRDLLSLLEQQSFDLIILDFHMPELNGLETMKALRTHTDERIRSIEVVLFSAEQDKNHLAEIESYGIKYFLQKPVNQTQFSQVLKQIVRTTQSELPHTDTSMHYLREITSGNADLMVELMDIFIDEVPDAINKLKSYYRQGKWEALRTLAHKLRSNYKYVGSQEGDQWLKLLEDQTGAEEKKQSYEAAIENLESITFRIVAHLQKEKGVHKGSSDNLQ